MNPNLDGKNHINIYSKSSTRLGRLLSNFAFTPFIHVDYGNFNSVEGFYYWLSTGSKYEEFRTLHGNKAKLIGMSIIKKEGRTEIPDFVDKIKEAINFKLKHNPEIYRELINSTLPLTHYYYFGSLNNYKIHFPPGSQWLTTYYEDIRRRANVAIK